MNGWSKLTLPLLLSAAIHLPFLMLVSMPLGGRGLSTTATQAPLVVSLQEAIPIARHITPSPLPVPAPQSSSATEPKTQREKGWNLYWPKRFLDTPPTIVEDLPLDSPALQEYAEGGQVILALFIGADGTVERVVIEESSVPEHISAAFSRHFLYSLFRPGIREGHFVRSMIRIEIMVSPLPQTIPRTQESSTR